MGINGNLVHFMYFNGAAKFGGFHLLICISKWLPQNLTSWEVRGQSRDEPSQTHFLMLISLLL